MKDKHGNELSSEDIINKIMFRIKTIILEFLNFLLRVVGYIPSHIVRIFCYRVSGIKIGKGSTIHMGARFYNPQNIRIGNDSIIGEDVVLDGRDAIKIGNHVDIASQVMIYNGQHDIDSDDFHAVTLPVIIEDYVFIGPRAIILPGVTIKKGAVVAAGAVVTKTVEEMKVVGGVPASVLRERKVEDLRYTLGRAALFR